MQSNGENAPEKSLHSISTEDLKLEKIQTQEQTNQENGVNDQIVIEETKPNGDASRPENGGVGKDVKRSTLTFHDVTYKVPSKARRGCPCMRSPENLPKETTILNSVR